MRLGILVAWFWEELYAKLLGLGQLLGCPWKLWGITVQASYWEGRGHQNRGYTSLTNFMSIVQCYLLWTLQRHRRYKGSREAQTLERSLRSYDAVHVLCACVHGCMGRNLLRGQFCSRWIKIKRIRSELRSPPLELLILEKIDWHCLVQLFHPGC